MNRIYINSTGTGRRFEKRKLYLCWKLLVQYSLYMLYVNLPESVRQISTLAYPKNKLQLMVELPSQ